MKNAPRGFFVISRQVSRPWSRVERVRHRVFPLLVLLLLTSWVGAEPNTALEDYVAAPDPAYGFRQVRAQRGVGYTEYYLDMTSQRWQASRMDRPLWQHRLIVIVPETVSSSTALLNVVDGVTGEDASATAFERQWAVNLGAVVVSLHQVPNQPLVFSGDGITRWEGAILGHSVSEYMNTGDETLPVLLPMTKSAVRAMDTVQQFVAEETDASPLESFVVTGASKRGWTAWLTAIVDPRVRAIVPVVYDALNLRASFRHHHRVYESVTQRIHRGYAESLREVVDMLERLSTPEGQALQQIIDPYEYRERLTLPKFIINASSDQFFVPDSAQFYFHDLVGPKYLRYVPNADHYDLQDPGDWTRSLENFYESVIRDEPLPRFTWTVEPDGSIRVVTETTPIQVKQWRATNSTHRDFRVETIGRRWTPSLLEDQGEGVYIGKITDPPAGYTAFFVELTFPSGGPVPHTFTTEVICSCVTAEFVVSEARGEIPFEVTLDASATVSTGCEISSWVWDFGDGVAGEGDVATHTYDRPGRFIVRLTATDAFGRSDSTKKSLEVICSPTDVSPWMTADIGGARLPGAVRFEQSADDAFRVCAAGRQIGGSGDQCFLVYRELRGDLELSARFSDVTGGLTGAAVGLMVRGGLESGAKSAAATLEPRRSPLGQSGLFRFRYRSRPGAISRTDTGESSTGAAANWVRLERSGDTVTAWSSPDGVGWARIGEPQQLPGLPETVLAGVVAVGRDLELETNAFEPLQALVSQLGIGGSRFVRGDCNDDGVVDLSDAVFSLGSLFLGDGNPGCDDACDSNDDGAVDISDALATLGVLFLRNGVIRLPGMNDCGVDPTQDRVTCAEYNGCP